MKTQYTINIPVHNLFEQWVEKTPKAVAITEPDSKRTLTFDALNRKSNNLACLLRKKGLNTGDIVAIMVERSVDMLVGIIAVLKAGGIYLPINPKNPPKRITYYLEDSNAGWLLSHRTHKSNPGIPPFVEVLDLENSEFLSDNRNNKDCLDLDIVEVSPDDFAYIIYTSGSTGNPKGVPITHGNLCQLLHWGYDVLNLQPTDRVVQNLSYFFDWSVWEIFTTLTSGATLVVPPDDVLLNPGPYRDFLTNNRVTVLHITPTQFHGLIGYGSETNKLETLKHLCIGAEKLVYDLVEKSFAVVGDSCRVYNMYGPTETTIMAAVLEIARSDFQRYRDLTSIPIGLPVGNAQLSVLDSDMNPVGLNEKGELYIGGNGVARGYLNNPQLTVDRFIKINETSFYKTGDIVRLLPENNIEFLGRIDHQLKIRGYRVELGEIENQLVVHPSISAAAVIAVDPPKGTAAPGSEVEKHLCAYYVAAGGSVQSQSVSNRELREFLSLRLPQYMVPSFFVSLESIPLNANGKIDIKVLPLPTTGDAGVPYIAPQNAVEKFLAEIWSTSLGLDVEVVGIDDNFFQLGGHSLRAAAVTSEIFKKYNVKVSIEELFRNPTIRELFNVVNTSVKEDYRPVEAVEKRDYYPLAPAQERLYILYYTAEADTVGYNIPLVLELSEEPSLSRLEETFQQLIRLYESFRTHFIMKGDQPVQRIMAVGDIDFRLEHLQCEASTPSIEGDIAQSNAPPEAVLTLMHRFVKPFDLSRPPLMRAALVNSADHRYFLLVDLHHIISDGISVEEFKAQLTGLYKGQETTVPAIQYKDYTLWLYSEILGPRIQRQKEYWLERFSGELPQLNLPTDYKRPSFVDYSGASIRFKVPPRDTHSLRRLASQENTTLYVVVGASFTVMLSKLSGVEDIIIGSPASGRSHPDLESMMGMFVNTLALRTFPTGEKQFRLFLREVRQTLLEAMENQDYPFDRLVTQLNLERDPSRNPLFDVMIALDTTGPVDDGAFLHPRRFRLKASLFDILLEMTDGESVYITLEYATSLFKEETIQGFLRYLKQVIAHVAASPQSELRDIDILSQQEKDELLVGFNRTGEIYPADQSLVRLFENRVAEDADGIAVCGFGGSAWLDSDATTDGDTIFTYRQLNEKSTRLARYLMEQGVRPGHMVALLTDRSVEMVVGMLAILKSGAAYVPLDPTAPLGRLKYITNECNVQLLLTRSNIIAHIPYDADYVCIDEEKIYYDVSSVPLDTVVDAALNAYVIFTSGSTGKPKGVAITHGNLSPLLHWGHRHLCIGSSERTLQNLSYYFDWSVWEIFITFTSGAALYIVPRETLLNPTECIKFIRDKGITVLHATPTQYSYLVDVDQHPLPLNYLFLGAEKLTLDLVQRSFQSVGQDCRVFNMYGPTEATIISAVLEIGRENSEGLSHLTSVPIGVSVGNTHLLILDKYLNFCPVNVTGELYIAGHGVAAGYLCDPEKTASSFIRNVYNSKGVIGERLYKTGDLARRLPDGTIEFLGRIDHQVKIRGFRIELGEIENRLLEHDRIKEVVVIAATPHGKSKNTEKFLCAYIVSKSSEDLQQIDAFTSDIKNSLAQILPDYMIPSYIILLENLPLNPNGKVNLKALPEPEQVAEAHYVAPRDHLEQRLVQIWSQVLDMEEEKIGIDDNFFHMGGHSLKGTVVSSKVHREFNVKLTLSAIFKKPTIRALADLINNTTEEMYQSIPSVPSANHYPLSYAQRRLWILCQFEEDATAYNIPYAFRISGPFQMNIFNRTIQTLVDRHESLRTLFIMIDGEPRQRIVGNLAFQVEETDLRNLDTPEREYRARDLYLQSANYVFHLETGPLFLFRVLRIKDEEYICVFNIHHIINDGWSQGIIIKEIETLYSAFKNGRGNPLEPLTLQYKEYSIWHNRLIEENYFSDAETYWLEKFKDKPNGMELPLDHPRRPVQTFNGRRVVFILEADVIEPLKEICRQEDVTMFMGMFAVFSLLMYDYTAQQDIILSCPIAGRKSTELYHLVGFLVNTLVYRISLDPNENFKQLLAKVKRETMSCYENQDYPFNLLIEKLALDRDLSQSPLFNVMMPYYSMDSQDLLPQMEDVVVSEYEYVEDFNMSKFDLTVFMNDMGKEIQVRMEYNSDLFNEDSICRMAANLKTLLKGLDGRENDSLYRLPLIHPEEFKIVTADFNNTDYIFTPVITLMEMFENQVRKHASKNAVVFLDDSITYDDLNKKANRIAHYLINAFSVSVNDIIGISMDRSIDMIAVILGIVKAGAGYLAIDPNYPEDRVLHMLSDSQTQLVIIDQMRPWLFSNYNGKIIDLDKESERIAFYPDENLGIYSEPGDIIYINYTSGSTGVPNGAMLSYGILTNLVRWQQEKTDIDTSLRCMQFTSINFCVSFQEIFITLCNGGQLYLIGDVERQEIDYLMDFLSNQKIEILYLPFSYLNFLFNETNRWGESYKTYLQHIITAGEQLKVTTGLKRFLDKHPHIKLHNHYGSSEMHVVTSYTLEASSAGDVPIPPAGKPVANTKIYILDAHLNVVPIGVWGELFIAGSWEVLGYINNFELTDKKLLNHPIFSRNGKRLYRSGDIGRWRSDGNIELKGRKDDMVKVRGFRVEPGEIESKFLAIENVKECVVVVKEDKAGQKYLMAYISIDNIDTEEVKRIISNELPQYMVPRVMVLENLPLMPNGKVDRSALPEPESTDDGYISPRDDIEKELAIVWADILEIDKDLIGIQANFFDLGGHSLKATRMVSKIHKVLNVRVPLTQIFKTNTLEELANYIKNATFEDYYSTIQPVSSRGYYPLSFPQKRLWFLFQKDPESTAYNMPWIWALAGEPDTPKLQSAFQRVINRHEVLRTYFKIVDDVPVQVILKNVNFEISCSRFVPSAEGKETSIKDIEAFIKKFILPFDISTAPLMRCRLLQVPEGKWLLLTDMHHIISDGISFQVLETELTAFYGEDGNEPSPLTIQYRDYACWQDKWKRQFEENREQDPQEKFWLNQFKGEKCPLLNLPLDFSRPVIQEFTGGSVLFEVGSIETASLKQIAEEANTTLYMIMLTLSYILLSKLSLQEDFLIGTTSAGRRRQELEVLIGMFVNTLVLRNSPSGYKHFTNFLSEVTERTLTALENEDYPLDELIKHIEFDRDPGRNPLFDVMFTFFDSRHSDRNGTERIFKPYHRFESISSKFDLSIGVENASGRSGEILMVTMDYCSRLFRKSTVQRFACYFKNLIAAIIKDSSFQLKDIELMDETEKLWLLRDLNHTGTGICSSEGSGNGFPLSMTLDRLFEDQVERTPDTVAVVGVPEENGCPSPVVTYRQLNRYAQCLANLLKLRGIGPDCIVAILAERSISMVTAMLAVLKAGGAYLPISPRSPEERIRFVLGDSGASVVLVTDSLRANFAPIMGSVDCVTVNIEEGMTYKWGSEGKENTDHIPSSAAYIIYTSGTTGKPKGVLVEHQNAVNTITWFGRSYNLGFGVNVLQMSDYTFDASVNQVFGTLLHGASLYLITQELLLDMESLRRFIIISRIHIINFVPTLLKELLDVNSRIGGLHTIISGAERLDDKTCKMILTKGYRLYNQYGPTEATIDALASECIADNDPVTLGKSIANTCCYILDQYMNPTPVGVTGQLYLSGAGIARGYVNRPELTAEKFIPNPFQSTFKKESAEYLVNARLYDTGDLARRLPDGNVQFLGRSDQQVKIRGFRIELQEIEKHLILHENVKDSVVLAIEREKNGDNNTFLCAYVVPTEPEDINAPGCFSESLTEYFMKKLPDYMVPAHFMVLSTLPRTTGGKVDRNSLPIPGLNSEDTFIAPTSHLEKKIADIWAEVLNIEPSTFGIRDNFFRLGGHSLKATIMLTKLHKALNVRLNLNQIFEKPTINGLIAVIKSSRREAYDAIVRVEEREYYPLSDIQERFYILSCMEGVGTAFNLRHILEVEGHIDRVDLEKTFRELIQRHESLRTSFHILEHGPVQKIHNEFNFALQYLEKENTQFSDTSIQKILETFVIPFELDLSPLFRATLLKIAADKYILIMETHHIVSDGTSMGIILEDFFHLHKGDTLPPLQYRYVDYALWQTGNNGEKDIGRQEKYWMEQFKMPIPAREIFADYPRPETQCFEGGHIEFAFEQELVHKIRYLASETGTTLHMILTSVMNILLARYSGSEDIVIGTAVAGRRHVEFQDIVGVFINALPIRNYPKSFKSFSRFLMEVKENVLNAYENQGYPFGRLIDRLGIKINAGRNPLFDVDLVVQNMAPPMVEKIEGLRFKPYYYEVDITQLDIQFFVEETDRGISVGVLYAKALFEHSTIERFIGFFKDILEFITSNPNVLLKDIPIDLHLAAVDTGDYKNVAGDFDF